MVNTSTATRLAICTRIHWDTAAGATMPMSGTPRRQGAGQPPSPRLIIVSPHLDDAVLSCGTLLARCPGSIVCTVFAGKPARPMRTDWDTASGFGNAHEAMAARWQEDEEALAICGAQPIWMDFLDSQYGDSPQIDEVAEALNAQFLRFDDYLPVCPLGLWHCDHERVGAACRQLLHDKRLAHCIGYEDAIYRAMPGVLQGGLGRLKQEGLQARFVHPAALGAASLRNATAIKRRAVQAYSSQARAFDPFPADVARLERFWRVGLDS
jgi:LmbE family N-acetylglucosaminyl deacetylase